MMISFAKNRLENICLILVYLIPIIILFAPAGSIYSFASHKAFLFSIVVELLVVTYALIVWTDQARAPRFNSSLLRVVILYIASLWLVSLLGINFSKSFFGTLERGDGLVLMIHLLGLLIVLKGLLPNMKQWMKFLEFSISISFLGNVITLIQFLQTGESIIVSTNLTSFFSNPNFFAHYLLFYIFFALFFLGYHSRTLLKPDDNVGSLFRVDFLNRFWRFLYYPVTIVLAIILLWQTGSRGAILGVVAGFVLLMSLTVWLYSSRKMRISLVLSMLGIIIFGSLYITNQPHVVLDKVFYTPYPGYALTQNSTILRRVLAWKAGWEALANSYMFGWGWGNFESAFMENFPSTILQDEGAELLFDKAHNIIIEHLVSGGVVGIFFLVLLYTTIINLLIKEVKKNYLPRLALFSLAALFVADFIFNLFGFYAISGYVLWFVFLGLLINIESLDSDNETKSNLQIIANTVSHRRIIVTGILAFLVMVLVTLPKYGLTQKLNKATELAIDGDYVSAHELFIDILDNKTPYYTESVLLFDNYALEIIPKLVNEDGLRLIDEATKLSLKAIKYDPNSLPLRSETLFIMEISLADKQELITDAVTLVNATKGKYSTHPIAWQHAGNVALASNEPAKALEYFQQAITLTPNFSLYYWLATKPAIILNNLALVDSYLSIIEKIEYPEPEANPPLYRASYSLRPERMRELAADFAKSGYYEKAIETLERLVGIHDLFLNNSIKDSYTSTLGQLAASYAAIGKNDKATAIAAELVRLDPVLEQETQFFLSELEKGNLILE